MLKHLVPMMKKMARPLLARRGAAQYPEHDLALAATFLWVIERHSGILLSFCGGLRRRRRREQRDLTCKLNPLTAFTRGRMAEPTGLMKRETAVRKFLPARFVVDRGHHPVIIRGTSCTGKNLQIQ